ITSLIRRQGAHEVAETHELSSAENATHRTYVRCTFTFFVNDTATTEIYTLSLHDALPISPGANSNSSAVTPARPNARAALKDTKDRKSTRLNSSHVAISYAVFCLKKKKLS